MDNIIEPTMDFDFSNLYLASPNSLTGGAYFTRIFLNNKPLYIQTPKSLTKQGFVKSGKKLYTDLMFDNNDTILINWLENLELKCQELIHAKGKEWFESALDKNDIESAFTSTIKLFKSGKFYLLRANVKPTIKIYNEVDEIINYENIKNETNIISILEIQGIKFTSRNFQIEIELKQSMVVSPDPFLDECFIKKPALSANKKNIINNLEETKDIEILEIDNSSNKNKKVDFIKEELDKDMIDIDMDMNGIDIEEKEFEKEQDQENILINNLQNSNNFDELKEVDFDEKFDDNLETITLQRPNEVYYKIYKAAREKAKQAKKEAVIAYLEAKNIKKTYMLDDLDENDDESDDLDNLSENEFLE
jgi:hypothetical protein